MGCMKATIRLYGEDATSLLLSPAAQKTYNRRNEGERTLDIWEYDTCAGLRYTVISHTADQLSDDLVGATAEAVNEMLERMGGAI